MLYKNTMSCPLYAGVCGSEYYCCPPGFSQLVCATDDSDCPIDPTTGAISDCHPNSVQYTQCQNPYDSKDWATPRGCFETQNEINEGSTKYADLKVGDTCPCGPTVEKKNGQCGYNNNPKKLV
jgi:hypothetical protein